MYKNEIAEKVTRIWDETPLSVNDIERMKGALDEYVIDYKDSDYSSQKQLVENYGDISLYTTIDGIKRQLENDVITQCYYVMKAGKNLYFTSLFMNIKL
jgi:hypothetical protein